MNRISFRPSDRLRQMQQRTSACSAAARVVPVYYSSSAAARKLAVPLCEFDGFYAPECHHDVGFAWTKPMATVVCHFTEPVPIRHIWLSLVSSRPGGSRLSVIVEGGPRYDLAGVRRNRIVRVSMGRKVKTNTIRLRLECETYVPHDVSGSDDYRELGVAVGRIVLGRNYLACFRGLQQDPRPDQTLAGDSAAARQVA